MEISDLDQMVTMLIMKDGLRPSTFLFNLEKRFSTDYAEILSRVEKYANAEEAMVARKDIASSYAKKNDKRSREKPSYGDRSIRPTCSSKWLP